MLCHRWRLRANQKVCLASSHCLGLRRAGTCYLGQCACQSIVYLDLAATAPISSMKAYAWHSSYPMPGFSSHRCLASGSAGSLWPTLALSGGSHAPAWIWLPEPRCFSTFDFYHRDYFVEKMALPDRPRAWAWPATTEIWIQIAFVSYVSRFDRSNDLFPISS